MIPVHPKELEVMRDIVARAKAPTITFNESAQNMRDQAAQKSRQHLDELDSQLDELLRRSPN